MAYDAHAQWLTDLPREAQLAALHLRGLSLLAAGWLEYRFSVSDHGPEADGDALAALSWALGELARALSPPAPADPGPAELTDPDRG